MVGTLLGERLVTRRRFAPGTRVTGKWVEGAATDTAIQASIQPARGDDLLPLPEGRRTHMVRKVYSATEISAGRDGVSPDRIIDGADEYEVIMAAPYPGMLGLGHYKALVEKVEG